jgi:Exostosin family
MKIYISTCDPMMIYRMEQLHEWLNLSHTKIHSFIEDPETADIILVPDIIFIYKHERNFLYRFLDKCYALDCKDRPHLIIPGLYASGLRFFHRNRIRGSSYLFNRHRRNAFLDFSNSSSEKNYLFSFIGGSTSWVRKRLLNLNFNRDDILVQCSTGTYNHWSDDQKNREEIQKKYVDIIRKSKFALCPRGIGAGSIRLFEVMELGVCPIIISDNWLPPQGVDWNRFALFVKESEIENLPAIAESYASESQERGQLARLAWEENFSDSHCFNRCIESIEDLSKFRIKILDRVILFLYPLIFFGYQCKEFLRKWLRMSILFIFRFLSLKFPYQLERD